VAGSIISPRAGARQAEEEPFTLPCARHSASLMADAEDARVSSIVDLVSRPNS